jgi:two-component system phosphate regulon sensor histidine kinase PhoR
MLILLSAPFVEHRQFQAIWGIAAALGLIGVVLLWKKLHVVDMEPQEPSDGQAPLRNLPSLLLERVDRAVVVCGRDGVIRLANDAAKRLFQASSLKGVNLRHVSFSGNLFGMIVRAFNEKAHSPISREFSVDYPEQKSLRVTAMRLDEGDVALWIADMSEMRKLEVVRRDFVANVSHELRTPMASIRAMAETIEDDPNLSPEDRRELLKKIIVEVDRLTLLSDDLLTLAAAESKAEEQAQIDLAEIAAYAVGQLQQVARAKGLEIELESPQSLIALGDRPKVIQVVMNLLQNAIRYTNKGGARVRVYEDRREAVLEVSDTGIGIGREHLPRIFERFYRIDTARSRETGGTGLGLAIVRHIAEGLGGRVEVESELGRGTTFRVRLNL